MADRPVSPGMIVGILGGGQLGRMLALAAAEMGLSCHVYCPDQRSPAFAVAAARTIAPYDDEAALAAFAGAVDIVTFEFENVPAATVEYLAGRIPVLPGARSLSVAQDRLAEKRLMDELGIAVPAYVAVDALGDIYSALARTGRPAILKTRRLGYDGKGQAAIRSGDDPVSAWRAHRRGAGDPGSPRAVLPRDFRRARPRPRRRRCAPGTSRRTATPPAFSTTTTVPADGDAGTCRRSGRHRREDRRRARPCRRAGRGDVRARRGRRRQAGGQRDRAPRPQFRPLDQRRRPNLPVRAAYSRDLPAGRSATSTATATSR